MENLFKLDSIENFGDNKAKYEKKILEPHHHIYESKGKGFRDVIIQAFNYCMGVDKIEVDIISNFMNVVHTNSLLMDDIQDLSELRRGIPATYVIYGVGRTITVIDYSIFSYLLRNDKSRIMTTHPESFMIELDTLNNLLQGQIMEIYWRDNFVCPTEEEYMDMVFKKTSQLFLATSKLMKLLSKNSANLDNLASLIGVYFQISDDYKGLQSKTYFDKKGFCDDIREGKFIFPIVHAINSRPNDKRILDILKMHTTDVQLKIKCLKLLDEFGSMEYTRNKLFYFKDLIIQEMEKIGFNNSVISTLFELQNFDQ